MEFKDSYQAGSISEKAVLAYLQKKHPDAYIQKGYCKEYDIHIPSINIYIEVKQDFQSQYTGNILVENSFNGCPSGISTSGSDWFVFVTRCNFYVITLEALKSLVKEDNIINKSFIGKGDKDPKTAYLVPREDLINKCFKVIPVI
jgi:hypothetical protein